MSAIISKNDLAVLKFLENQNKKVARSALPAYLKLHETSIHFSITRLKKLKLIDMEESGGPGAAQNIQINKNGEKVLNGLAEGTEEN